MTKVPYSMIDGAPVNVRSLGAVGDGVADDTVAIQAAFNSGAKQVVFPPGTYLCTAGLTVPNWLHIVGQGYAPTISTGTGAVVLRFTGTSGNFLTCGFNPTIENIVFWNTGGTYNDTTDTLSGTTASAIKLTDNITLAYCSFSTWADCIRFGASTYYVKTYAVEFNRCTNGYRTDGAAPYNVDIHSPISRKTTNFFTGQTAYPARNVKVFGGSIEGYSTICTGFLDFASFGTYYETVATRAGAYAIDPGVNGASVSLFGNLIYMNHTARFVNMSGLTSCSLSGSGNQFEGVAPSSAIMYYLPSSGSVNLTGDLFGVGHPNNAVYVDSATNAAKFNGITFPTLPSGNSQAGYSGMQMIGSRGFISIGLTAQPASRTTGMTVLADGTSWDPLSLAGGRPYWVIWQGDRWRNPGG